MKKLIAGVVLAASTLAAPAFAWEGHVVACYDKVWVPASYTYGKTLVMAAHTEWEHNKKGQMVRVHYPAVYKEEKTMKTPGHYVAKEAACK